MSLIEPLDEHSDLSRHLVLLERELPHFLLEGAELQARKQPVACIVEPFPRSSLSGADLDSGKVSIVEAGLINLLEIAKFVQLLAYAITNWLLLKELNEF